MNHYNHPQIFVSSCCLKATRIADAVKALAAAGFRYIEVSGGTKYYPEWESDLLDLKQKYDLVYRAHNYFPPPKEDFVVNLASFDEDVVTKSTNLVEEAIAFSRKTGSAIYGMHAGFLVDISAKDIGKAIQGKDLNEGNKAVNLFCERVTAITNRHQDVKFYLENNVLSPGNLKNFGGKNPVLCSNAKAIADLKKSLEFSLLLDVAHLKVSCTALGLNFIDEMNLLMNESDYIHLSDNDGQHDSNQEITAESELMQLLKKYDFAKKTVTVEVYGGLETLQRSYEVVREALF